MGAVVNACCSSIFGNSFEKLALSREKDVWFDCNGLLRVRKTRVSCEARGNDGVQERGMPRGVRMSSVSKDRTEEYNSATRRRMRNPYEYHHDLGMNYALTTDGLIVGSQPQKPEDIDHLKNEENVAYILNLQQDRYVEYWGVDLQSILRRCEELGIRHLRRPGITGPGAVSSLEWSISDGKCRAHVHCTASLGRALAVAIAYMYWFSGINLDQAYDILTSKRPCGPSKRAIHGATYDLAKYNPWKEPFESLPDFAFGYIADWERNLIQDRVRSLGET